MQLTYKYCGQVGNYGVAMLGRGCSLISITAAPWRTKVIYFLCLMRMGGHVCTGRYPCPIWHLLPCAALFGVFSSPNNCCSFKHLIFDPCGRTDARKLVGQKRPRICSFSEGGRKNRKKQENGKNGGGNQLQTIPPSLLLARRPTGCVSSSTTFVMLSLPSNTTMLKTGQL